MGRDILSNDAYTKIADDAKNAGSATHKGEKRHREGKGLDPLVDPSGHGLVRRALSFYEEEPGSKLHRLRRGVAMLVETRLDTTGSMGDNVEIAMHVLPHTYDLLKKIDGAVLSRYDVQMITSIFADYMDEYILCRSQAEFDERIAEQMTLMVPEGGGAGNGGEDPQYGFFGGAYLTQADINRYGLKYYDFTITDEPCRELTEKLLYRVFGNEVFEKVAENGFKIDSTNLPSVKQVLQDLQKRAHTFLFIVDTGHSIYDFWVNLYGRENVIVVPNTELIPAIQASVIGLTEGVLDFQSLSVFLTEKAGVSVGDVESIQRAVSGIPIGAQRDLENFDKIPKAGDLFENKRDLYPVENPEKFESSGTNSMWK